MLLRCVVFLCLLRSGEIFGVRNLNADNAYRDIPISDKPGIYYERVSPLRLQQVDWRVSVFIEVDKFVRDFPSLTKKIKDIVLTCEDAHPQAKCSEFLRQEYLSERMKYAATLVNEIRTLATEHELPADSDEETLNSMVKRSVPLGMIGSLSKSLFGTMNEEDAEYINGEIDRLYADQTKLTRIIGNQIHITTSRLQDLHEEHLNESRRIETLYGSVTGLWEKLNRIDKETATTMFDGELTRFVYRTEQKIERYIEICQKYIDIISAAQAGRYDPTILSATQLSEISREIRLRAPEFEFPLTPESLHGKNLARIAHVDLVFHQERMLIMIHIPLLDRIKYRLYHMHPWPVPQGRENTGSAYIAPSTPYIAVSTDRRVYFFVDAAYFASCRKTNQKYICPTEMPILETATTKDCEVEMLLRPSVAAYRQCDVRTKTQHSAFWKHLPSQGGWLYSLESPENVHILCPGREEITKIITGTGILYLSANCMGRTGSITLTGIRTYDNKNQFFYTPQVNLNITLLIPDLNNTLKEIKELEVKLEEPDKRVDFGKPWENGKSLFELESKIREIGKHRRNKQHEENLIMSGFALHGIVVTVICIYCFKEKIVKSLTRIKTACRRKQKKASDITTTRVTTTAQSVQCEHPNTSKEIINMPELQRAASTLTLSPGILPRQEAQVDY